MLLDHVCRVGGFPADAVIGIGSDVAPDDRAAINHRVGGGAANPTHGIRTIALPAPVERVDGAVHPTSTPAS